MVDASRCRASLFQLPVGRAHKVLAPHPVTPIRRGLPLHFQANRHAVTCVCLELADWVDKCWEN